MKVKVVALLAAGIAIGVVMVGSPAGAHVGGTVNHLWYHLKPKADARYLPGGNLPSGKTIRGTYRISGTDQQAGSVQGSTAISFGWKLSSTPFAHFIQAGTEPPVECPGSAENPQAAAGHLCVYEVTDFNVTGQALVNTITNTSPQATPYGAGVLAESAGDGVWGTGGTWAVTSP